MEMTIDEIIAKEQEMSEILQYIVDTQMVSKDLSLDDMYCGDTEIIEEKLKSYQELADFHNKIANTMRKYQKIQNILDEIRAEIEQLSLHKAQYLTSDNKVCIDSQAVLDILDKYKAEIEPQESEKKDD